METDNTLLNEARMMKREALVRIFDLYSPALFNYALRLCSDPILADHIVGDVFAKLLDQLAEGKGPTSNLRSYLYETAHHRIIDEARYSKRRVPLDVAGSFGQDTQPVSLRVEDQVIIKNILQIVQNELTDDQRHVIILRFFEQFSLRDTALIMGKTVEHVKVIQNRAIASLRRAFKQKEIRQAVAAPRARDFSRALGF